MINVIHLFVAARLLLPWLVSPREKEAGAFFATEGQLLDDPWQKTPRPLSPALAGVVCRISAPT